MSARAAATRTMPRHLVPLRHPQPRVRGQSQHETAANVSIVFRGSNIGDIFTMYQEKCESTVSAPNFRNLLLTRLTSASAASAAAAASIVPRDAHNPALDLAFSLAVFEPLAFSVEGLAVMEAYYTELLVQHGPSARVYWCVSCVLFARIFI
jgi:hypothetical protein